MGQFDSDLLGPSEVETWDTLMGAQDPNWNQPAPEPAADQMYAPAPELSYAAPYEAPAQNYGTDASAYVPEMAYGGPAEPDYVDPFMAGDATQQYQDPFMQQAYAPAPYVDNSGAIPPGSLDSWESPSNFTENEAFSTVNGEDIGGRSTPGAAPASAPGFFESRNPQFAQSNAQFDATTNPANRGSADILGGLYGGANDILRAGQGAVGDVAQTAGNFMNPYGWNAPAASGYAGSRASENNIVGDIARFAAEAQVPSSVPELALFALADPAFEAIGPAYRALRNPAAREGLGDFAGRVPSMLENPAAVGGDLVNIPRLFPAAEAARYPEGVVLRGGGAADDATKWLDKVIAENPGQAKGITNYRAQFGDEAAVQWFADSGVGKTAAEAKQVLAGMADEVPPAPITDLKGALRQGLGIAADDATALAARQLDADAASFREAGNTSVADALQGEADKLRQTVINRTPVGDVGKPLEDLSRTKAPPRVGTAKANASEFNDVQQQLGESYRAGTYGKGKSAYELAQEAGRVASAAEDATGLAARTPEPMKKALNLSGQAGDPIDNITEQVLRDAEGWPVATPGSQAGLFDEPVQGFMEQAAGPNYYKPGDVANPDVGLNQLRLNRGLQETAGGFDPNAVAPESGFLRNEPTMPRMQSADGPANYAPGTKVEPEGLTLNQQRLNKGLQTPGSKFDEDYTEAARGFMQGQPTTPAMQSAPGPAKYEWQAVPELEVPLAQQKLIKAAIENPSTSMLTPLVEEIFKGKLGQQAFDIKVARANKPLWSQAIDEAIALTGLPRELKASFDMSIPGRQGLALAFRHPLEWFDSWKTVLPSMGSENGFKIVNADAENWVTKWKQMAGEKGVVHLNTIDRTAKGTERIAGFEAAGDNFASKVSARLGTGKFERSAVAFINHQRAKTMDTMFTSLWESGERNPQVFRDMAAIIDHATGYGGAPLKGDLMGRLLFSQRFMTSRFQFLVDPVVEGLKRGDLKTARAATENLVAFAGGSATLLALIDAGAEKVGVDALDVNWDPRSSDFGKIRIGPTRIDFGAGFLPLLRSAAQIGTGKRATVTGDIIPIQKFDQDTFKKESYVKASGNVALSFFRNKLDPVTQELVSRAFYGTDPVGNKPTQIMSFQTLENMFAPLLLSSTLESMRQGASPGATVGLAGSEAFGGSGSTYGQGQAAQQDIAQQKYGVDYSKLPSQYQAAINAEAIANGVDVDIGSRLAPWWDSRNDAVEYYKTQIAPGQESDPRIAAALEATSYQDLGNRLQMVFEKEYNMTRTQAEKEVTKTLDAMVGENVDVYRKDITAADPGFAKSWLDAYNARETKYKPPVWVQELAGGK